MTRKRDLGLPLAIAGSIAVVGAVIAGFIIVGGPGDARARRLDDQTMERIASSVQLAQCAFISNGQAPATMDEAMSAPAKSSVTPGERCGSFQSDRTLRDIGSGQPDRPGDVTYNVIDASHVRLCGNFRTSFNHAEAELAPTRWISWPELEQDRPAGPFCYELELKPEAQADAR